MKIKSSYLVERSPPCVALRTFCRCEFPVAGVVFSVVETAIFTLTLTLSKPLNTTAMSSWCTMYQPLNIWIFL